MLNPNRGDIRLAALLGVVGGAATSCLFPYLLAIMPQIAMALRAKGVPLAVLVAAQSLQAAVLLGIASWIGLRLGHRLGLDAPWLRAWILGEPPPRKARSLILAAALGVLAGFAILGAGILFARFGPPPPLLEVATWKAVLASFYGGIAEEILSRLFCMTVLVWLLARLSRGPRGDGRLPRWVMACAIAGSAVLFAAGHLPTAIHVLGTAPAVISRVLVLNTLPGLLFGWLYWRGGLEQAMTCHFAADLVLHGIGGS